MFLPNTKLAGVAQIAVTLRAKRKTPSAKRFSNSCWKNMGRLLRQRRLEDSFALPNGPQIARRKAGGEIVSAIDRADSGQPSLHSPAAVAAVWLAEHCLSPTRFDWRRLGGPKPVKVSPYLFPLRVEPLTGLSSKSRKTAQNLCLGKLWCKNHVFRSVLIMYNSLGNWASQKLVMKQA